MKYSALILNKQTLSASSLKTTVDKLVKNRKSYLLQLSQEEIIRLLDSVSKHWLHHKNPFRQKAEKLLTESTGCSREVISMGLDLAFSEVQARHLKSALETFHDYPRPQLSAYIFAGIIPTPMLFDIYWALLLKSAVIAKAPSRSPLFPILLTQSITKIDKKLGQCVASLFWHGGKINLEKALFKEADLISAYGDDATVCAIKNQIQNNKQIMGFGHKLSFSVIGSPILQGSNRESTAHQASLDIALYDQQGCLSPHILYCEGHNDTVKEWCHCLAQEMQKINRSLPPGKSSLGEASLAHQVRGQSYFRKGSVCLSSHPTPDWTVIYEENPQFHPSCLSRIIFVKPIKKIHDLVKILKPWKGKIQGLGYAVDDKQMKDILNLGKVLQAPVVVKIGKLQNLTFHDHIRERAKMMKRHKNS